MWLRLDGLTECVFGEAYTSDVFLEMEKQITPEPGSTLETVIAPMMLHSDSTHLANFGMASLWPVYLGLGLMSKYTCAMPTSFGNHHVVYFPSVRLDMFSLYLCVEPYISSSFRIIFRMLTRFASIHACNFAIPTKGYMLQCLDTKELRNTTERRDDNAVNRINRVKLGGAHDLT